MYYYNINYKMPDLLIYKWQGLWNVTRIWSLNSFLVEGKHEAWTTVSKFILRQHQSFHHLTSQMLKIMTALEAPSTSPGWVPLDCIDYWVTQQPGLFLLPYLILLIKSVLWQLHICTLSTVYSHPTLSYSLHVSYMHIFLSCFISHVIIYVTTDLDPRGHTNEYKGSLSPTTHQ